jgi:hypothetical protein
MTSLVEVVVEYEYEPECGDGWHEPRFPEQINIYMVKDKDGNEVDFLGHEDFLEQEIAEHVHREAAERAGMTGLNICTRAVWMLWQTWKSKEVV